MAYSNPSFEDIGATSAGYAANWAVEASSELRGVASFGNGYGWEGLERGWVLPLGRKASGWYRIKERSWAQVTNNRFAAGTPPGSGYVASPVVVIDTGGIPPSSSITVTMTYTNEDSVGSRAATATIPVGADSGYEYSFALESDDEGFISIENLQTSPAIDAKLKVRGSWIRTPLNEDYKMIFVEANLEESTADNGFEANWGNMWGILATAPSDAESTLESTTHTTGYTHEISIVETILANDSVYENEKDTKFPAPGPGFMNDYDAILTELALFGNAEDGTLYNAPVPAAATMSVGKIGATWTVTLGNTVALRELILRNLGFPDPYEDFEEYWDDATLTRRPKMYSLVAYITSTKPTGSTFVITDNINDRISLKISGVGTFVDLDIKLAAGSYTAATMCTHLNQKIGEALDNDLGYANSGDVVASLNSEGQLLITMLYGGPAGSSKPTLELVEPVSDSAWGELGFITGERSRRLQDGKLVATAGFDAANEAFEDFEEEFDSNETSDFTFEGSDLAAALFDDIHEPFEDFEEQWALNLDVNLRAVGDNITVTDKVYLSYIIHTGDTISVADTIVLGGDISMSPDDACAITDDVETELEGPV